MPGVLMKQAEQTRGSPLGGAAAKVTSNYFLIGLSAVETDMQRNMQLLKERSWFDIPIVYNNGRRAILAMTAGERALEEAFKAWEQTSADPAPLPVPRIPPEAGQRHNDPWMRGITLPTSVHREMKVSVYSRLDVGQVRMMMIEPVTSLPMTFGADPYGGMQTLKFAGARSGHAGRRSAAFVVQVSAQKTEDEARASYQVLQQKYPSVLGGRDPIVRRAELGQSGTWYRVHVGSFATSEQATTFCNTLKDAGGQCIVQKN